MYIEYHISRLLEYMHLIWGKWAIAFMDQLQKYDQTSYEFFQSTFYGMSYPVTQ